MNWLKQVWFDIRRTLLIKLAGGHVVVINARVVGYIDNIDPDWSVVSQSSFVSPDWQSTTRSAMGLPIDYAAKIDRLYNLMLQEHDGSHG